MTRVQTETTPVLVNPSHVHRKTVPRGMDAIHHRFIERVDNILLRYGITAAIRRTGIEPRALDNQNWRIVYEDVVRQRIDR